MSAVMLLLLNQAARHSSGGRTTGYNRPAVAPSPETGAEFLSANLPARSSDHGAPPRSFVEKTVKETAAGLINCISKDKSSLLAARLKDNLLLKSGEIAGRIGLGPYKTEAELVKSAIGQLLAPHRSFGSPESLFIAAEILWDRAKTLGVPIHENWNAQLRNKLDKQLGIALYQKKEGIDYSRARYFLRDGAELFQRLADRTWLKNPLIMAGAAIARAIGGSPAFTVGDVLSPKTA